MKFDIKHFFAVAIVLISFFLLCQFRTVPMSQFWKGYRVLYVFTEELAENDILSILQKNGCSSVISSLNQKIPLMSSLAPLQTQNPDSYIFRRNAFFTDKNQRASVFYIPESQSSGLEKSIRELSAFQGTSAGTDGKTSFPWVAPFLAFIFFLILLFFSNKRLLFFSGTAFYVLFTFCHPLYTVSASVCLYLFSFFLFHKFWGRKSFIRTALNSPYILALLVSPVLILLLSSPLLAFFYCFSFLASAALLYLYFVVEEKNEENYSFRPVYIRSARMIPVVGYLGIRLLSCLVIFLFVIFAAFNFIGKVSSFAESSSLPSLPSPVNSSNSELVKLDDYLQWSWNTITFPYQKITELKNTSPSEGDTIFITDYVEKDGKIESVQTPVYVYNNEFRDNAIKSIDKLNYPALEKLMLRQGKNTSFGYAKSSSVTSAERFAVPLLLILAAIPSVLGIYYILGRKRYGLSI